MSATAEQESLTGVRLATACGGSLTQRPFRSRNCPHSESPWYGRCCSPALERGCERNLSGVRLQVGDSGCPSDQNKCQARQYNHDDYRRRQLSHGETKTRHYLPGCCT